MDDPTTQFVLASIFAVAGALYALVAAVAPVLSDGTLRAQLEREGGGPEALKRLLDDVSGFMTRARLGRTVFSTLGVVFSASAGSASWGFLGGVGAACVALIVEALLLEFVSVIARKRASRLVKPLVVWLRPLLWLISPIAIPIVAFSRAVEGVVPPAPIDEQASDLAVERVIEQGEQSGSIPEEHAKLLKSVLEFEDIIAREVMVPRTRVVAIDIETPLLEVLALVIDSGHSRYPVYRERLDQVEGLLYAKDLFRTLKDGPTNQSLAQLIRKPPFFVAESQKIRSLLREMQSRRIHLAVVVDEFGGTSGIVTLEDILEEIVGDIRDEHDIEEAPIQKLGEAKYLIDAEISVRDLEEALGTKLPESEGEFDSLGGLLVQIRGRVPAIGEVLQFGALEFYIRESDERHVRRVEVHRLSNLRTASSPNHDVTSVL